MTMKIKKLRNKIKQVDKKLVSSLRIDTANTNKISTDYQQIENFFLVLMKIKVISYDVKSFTVRAFVENLFSDFADFSKIIVE